MKKIVVVLMIMFFVACATEASEAKKTREEKDTSVSLFNGKDFTGWKVPKNNTWWTVKDGVIVCKSGPKQKGSILWTENKYTNFLLTLDFKMGKGRVDSGVFIKSANDQIQIGNSGSMKRDMTCSPYIASKRRYPVEAKNVKKLLKPTDWNTMTIEVVGKTYKVTLNGEEVLNYTSETAKDKGAVGLQLHPKRDMHINFKNLKIKELP